MRNSCLLSCACFFSFFENISLVLVEWICDTHIHHYVLSFALQKSKFSICWHPYLYGLLGRLAFLQPTNFECHVANFALYLIFVIVYNPFQILISIVINIHYYRHDLFSYWWVARRPSGVCKYGHFPNRSKNPRTKWDFHEHSVKPSACE